jgi:uncharacterized protein
MAESILRSNYSVIVDATFLDRQRRQQMHELAKRMGVPFRILRFSAPEETLRERVANRAADGRDASEATVEVLTQQLAEQEPLSEEELQYADDMNIR